MINTKRPNTDDYTQVGFIEAKDNQGNYQNIDKIYDNQGNIVFQQGYLNEYQGADDFSIPAIGKPLIDYTIYGNTFQDGIPTPDNPIMPQGTGERTGNLVAADVNRTTSIGGLSVVWKKDSSEMTINGKATSGDSYRFATIELDAGTYTLSITGLDETGGSKTGFYLAGVDTVRVQGVRTYTITEPTIARLQFVAQTSDISYENRKVTIMFTKTSTPLPYEPYGYKIPISSASTTTPVYLGEVETTRKIKKLVLTGEEEGWTKAAGITATDAYQNYNLTSNYLRTDYIVTHMPVNSSSTNASTHGYIGQRITLCMDKTLNLSDIDLFKAWLASEYSAGHPVTLYYVRTTPETGIVNEPLMRIGDYVDSVDFSQAGVDIPTLKRPNTTVIDITTSLPPSEVYAKYRGSKTQKYDLFLAANGDSFAAKNGQSLYIGDDT